MKLFYSAASPYVRKVRAMAHETGQTQAIELLACAASPVKRDSAVVMHNPSGKIPALLLDDGEVLYDSRVICQYLDSLHTGKKMYPESGRARWRVLRQEALADGLLDAALLARYESLIRPAELQWSDWIDGQMDKIVSSIARLELDVTSSQDIDAGVIACACALGYLDFRFPELDWRSGHPALTAWFDEVSSRPSMVATRPSN